MESRRLAAAAMGAAVCLGSSLALTPARVEAAAARPNIVVVYTDDFSPDADWLWSDPGRTPTLARFVEDGVHFADATAVTSLCSPARATLLTGTYGHKNGVIANDHSDFDVRDTVGRRLHRAGYYTAFVGKYMNKMRALAPKPRDVRPYATGWDAFDVLHTPNGKFYDYALWTKQGESRYGSKPRDHSTRVLTERAAQHIRQAPADQPIFEILSLYDGHEPNLPMHRFEGDPACADVAPWQGPAYNEADVSDKPQSIQVQPLLSEPSYDLRTRCEEMMTVDWATNQLRKALRASGRLDDTLLIFSSDNGFAMGDHRLVGKNTPYSHPVILYALWPKQMGDQARTIDEPVSNADLAPTFCDLAGCKLPGADGKSLVPILTGASDQLDRDFVYQEKLNVTLTRPAYYGLRTTERFDPDHRWVYTELSTGERELYDRATDPWQLQNLAGDPAYANIVQTLHTMLHEKVVDKDGVTFIPIPGSTTDASASELPRGEGTAGAGSPAPSAGSTSQPSTAPA